MPDKPWKRAEREYARLFGGVRAGPTGREGPDILHSVLAPEVKTRKSLPDWLLDVANQAKDNAGNKIPVVILHRAGDKYKDALVILSMDDFLHLMNIYQEYMDE